MRVPRSAATAGAGMPGDDLRPEARARTRFPGTAFTLVMELLVSPRIFRRRTRQGRRKEDTGRPGFRGKKAERTLGYRNRSRPAHVHLPGFPELCGRGL